MTRETISVLITRDELMTLLNLRQRFEEIAPPAEKDQLESFLNRAVAIHGYDDHLAAWDDELGEATLRRQAAEEAEHQADAESLAKDSVSAAAIDAVSMDLPDAPSPPAPPAGGLDLDRVTMPTTPEEAAAKRGRYLAEEAANAGMVDELAKNADLSQLGGEVKLPDGDGK